MLNYLRAQCTSFFCAKLLNLTCELFSQIGEICHFTDRRDEESYAHDLVFNNNRTNAPASLLHGKIIEPNAIKAFENDASNPVKKCGTLVSIENPFIVGSPDGKVARVGLLEAKCPYSITRGRQAGKLSPPRA